jgi:hypothetical protein
LANRHWQWALHFRFLDDCKNIIRCCARCFPFAQVFDSRRWKRNTDWDLGAIEEHLGETLGAVFARPIGVGDDDDLAREMGPYEVNYQACSSVAAWPPDDGQPQIEPRTYIAGALGNEETWTNGNSGRYE